MATGPTLDDQPDPAPEVEVTTRHGLAEQELRLISALAVILGLGLFFALPFVLSIGSVVFLPVTAALVLTVVLSPLADKLAALGLPNVVASFIAMLILIAIILFGLALILQPAIALFDQVPELISHVGHRFNELQDKFAWLSRINTQLSDLLSHRSHREVVLASPTPLETIAIATPSVIIEIVLTLLMAFFMVEARVRMRQKLLLGRTSFGSSIKAARVMREIQDRVASYILTVALINVGVGIIVATGAWLFGLEAPIMWGGLAALLNFIPYVGPAAMAVVLGVFGIGSTETIFPGLFPAMAYLCLHAVEANFITPSILGARFTVNPLLILIALSYFSWIWGVIGALLSVPILLILTALFDHIGHPNLIGFVFGEPLFASNPFDPPGENSGESSAEFQNPEARRQ
ncbi:MAG: AI-2E family transporter [Sphingomonadaceae bacterium]